MLVDAIRSAGGRLGTRWGLACLAAAIAATFTYVSFDVAGGGPTTEAIRTSWQLIDVSVLETDALTGLWYQHTQPPLFNLVVATTFASWWPFATMGSLSVFYGLTYVVTAVLLTLLLRRLGVGPVTGGVATVLAVANPTLLTTVSAVSYELPVALILVALVLATHRYLSRPTTAGLLWVAGLVTAGGLTRTLLHPAWAVALIVVVAMARPLPWRRLGAALAIAVVGFGAVMSKNAVLFDHASLSTWTGFNLQRGVVGPMKASDVERELAAHRVSSLADEPAFQGLDGYADSAPDCTPTRQHPVLARKSKDAGDAPLPSPNFNNACYLPLYEASTADAAYLVRHYPGRYLSTRTAALTLAFTLPTPPDAPLVADAGGTPRRTTWLERTSRAVLLPTEVTIDQSDWNLPLLPGSDELPVDISVTLLGCYLVIVGRGVWSLGAIVRTRSLRQASATDLTWLIINFCVTWLIVGAALVELGENGRFRTSVDPLLVAGAIAVVSGPVTRLARTRRR